MGSSADVVTTLTQQHEQIRQLFDRVIHASGKERAAAFYDLRRLLAVHETAEEEIVHPVIRRRLGDGDLIADARLREERVLKQQLAELESRDVDSAEFAEKLAELHTAVEAHARLEEAEEFPRLRDDLDEGQLQRMATAVELAKAVAPTRPHPGLEVGGEHVLAGPFAAMLDRARDLISGKR